MENAFGAFDSLRVEAVPLWHPQANPELLSPTDDGRWIFRYAGHTSGPWLITGWVGGDMCMRPLRATVPGEASERVRSKMEEIVRTGRGDIRRTMFEETCEMLSGSWDHEEWTSMEEFLGTLGIYPTHTFEAVRAVVGSPGTAILALMRAQTPHELRRRWRHFEDLPFSWFMLPLRSWLLAGITLRDEARRRADACRHEEVPGDWGESRFVRDLLGPLTASQLPPFVICVREAWCRTLAGFPDVPDGFLMRASNYAQLALISKSLVDDHTRDLLQRHADDTWPQVHLEEVHQDARDLAERQIARWWTTDGVGFRRDALNGPVIAAAIMVVGRRSSEETVRAIRRLRSFDEDWFDQVHAVALAVILSEKLAANASFLDEVAGL